MNKPIKILSIEDDEFIKIFLKDAFWIHSNKDEYNLQIVDNFAKVETLLSSQTKPDLIIMGLILGKFGDKSKIDKEAGFRFLEKLKSDPQTKKIKVIIFSAYGDKELQNRALKLGADRFLVKGEYLPQELMRIFQKIINNPNNQ